MISLAQMTVAGIAGYAVAIFGQSGTPEVSLRLAVVGGGRSWRSRSPSLCATFIGWLSVRTEGIYTIMITLAIGVAFFYLAQQNYALFNGFQGFQRVQPPALFGVELAGPDAVLLPGPLLGARRLCRRGLPRAGAVRHRASGHPRQPPTHGRARASTSRRTASPPTRWPALMAAVGGVLMVWYNGLISPGSVGTTALINILIIAVLGGMRHPSGRSSAPWSSSCCRTSRSISFDRERFNLVIGGVFLVIVLFSPDGLLGWWARLAARLRRGGRTNAACAPHSSKGG